MKASRYNYFVDFENKTICFNGVSGKVFTVKYQEFQFLNSVLSSSTLQKEKRELTNWLSDHHFLVNENDDEAELFRLKNRATVFSGPYHMIINPTLECNFRCWYCYEQHPKGYMSAQVANRVKQYVDKLINEEKFEGLALGWFGGEPLLYFHEIVYPLATYFKSKIERLGLPFIHNITTNGYYINKDMIRKFNEIGLYHFQITLDGDRETHNRTRNAQGVSSFDIILQNIINLCNDLPKSEILLRINYTNEIIAKDFSSILQVIPHKLRSHIRLHFQRVWQTVEKSPKCNDDIARNIVALREMGFFVIPDNHFSVKRTHLCYADRFNYIHVNYDGKIYKCTARDYSEDRSIGKLEEGGVIQWKSDILKKLYAKANFENEKCMKCKQLPICGGPCLQNTLDYNENKSDNFCIHRFKEMDVNTFIREYYLGMKKKNEIQYM